MAVSLLVVLCPVGASYCQDTADTKTTLPTFPLPDNLVLDLRLFESRTQVPDYSTMESLSFVIRTDGREVNAQQWVSTLAKKVPDSFMAALVFETASVEPVADGAAKGITRFEWVKGSRSIKTEIRVENYHPAGTFDAKVHTQLMRGSKVLRELSQEVKLQKSRTAVWSSADLEISATDYLSHFREYQDREHRGLLYERLRPYTIFLVMTATPRLLTEEELRLGPRQALTLPPDAQLPVMDNATGLPLQGTIVLGFVVDASGAPINPQILRSTLPEANLSLVDQASRWRFPSVDGSSEKRRGQVEVKLDIPVESPEPPEPSRP
jgi:hypothetical protein